MSETETQSQPQAEGSPSPQDIHNVIRQEGEEQLERKVSAIALSALAAGLSMGFSFITMAALQAKLGDVPWRDLIASFGYTLGFLIVILGRQHLYTETTLTPVLPVLSEFTVKRLGQLLRFWAVVLSANLFGTWLFAWGIAHESAFKPETWHAMTELGTHAAEGAFGPMMLKSILAGWLIALMVWLLPSAGPAKMLIIVTLTYTVAVSGFSHVIAGSCEAAFAVIVGAHTFGEYVGTFLIPTLLGNTIGGVALTAILNHAPLAAEA